MIKPLLLCALLAGCSPAALKIPGTAQIPVRQCPYPPVVERPVLPEIPADASVPTIVQSLVIQRDELEAWGRNLESILDSYRAKP